jgi:NAD(P)-dependent dehydrogenase (short-subunit alcohol dehydrogenase family)
VTTLIEITYECDSFHLNPHCIIDVNVTSTHQGEFMDIQGKVFIVTGGASGLGEGTARMLAAHGGKVVIADMQAEKGEAIAKELGGAFVKCDVSNEADGQAVVAKAVSLGKLVGLVNCAGIAPAEKTVGKNGAHSLAVFSKTITVNLIGSFNMMRLASEAMCKNEPEATGERGVMISTASVAAYDGQIGQAAYAASKGGVVGMTLPIARDLARNGIRNMTIAPGIFGTPMVFGMPQEVQDALAAAVPFPSRLGTPHDYAKLVKHILENDMLNGEVIRLDGAIRLAPK